MSTEQSLRTVITDAIKAIAVTSLGFDNTNGNVKDYLIQFQRKELYSKYLIAPCDGGIKQVRCWAVQVFGHDPFFAVARETERLYSITIAAYYGMDKDGAGIELLTTHARKVREVIKNLGPSMSNLTDLVTDVAAPTVEVQTDLDESLEPILLMQWTLSASKSSPTW